MTTRLERGLVILERLQRGVRLSPSQLAESMGVTRRTVFRDIASLNEMGFDIQFDQATLSYSHRSSNDGSANDSDFSGVCLDERTTDGEDNPTDRKENDRVTIGSTFNDLDPKLSFRSSDLLYQLTCWIVTGCAIRISEKIKSNDPENRKSSERIIPVELIFRQDGWHLLFERPECNSVERLRVAQFDFHFDSGSSPP